MVNSKTSAALLLAMVLLGSAGLGALMQVGPDPSRVVADHATSAYAPGVLPDPKLTPGDMLLVTAKDVCVAGYSKSVRNVPENIKRAVYREYGIRSHKAGEFEVDHLISLELGGSNSIKNLWPESYLSKPWNAHMKDMLENRLHAEVCAGKITLSDAQNAIATDWVKAYVTRFGQAK